MSSQQLPEEWFIKDSRINAAVSWLLVGALVAVAVAALWQFLVSRMLLAALAALVAIVPALVSRTWTRTVPWPLLLICTIPLSIGGIGISFFVDFVTALSVAALGMLVVVSLQLTGGSNDPELRRLRCRAGHTGECGILGGQFGSVGSVSRNGFHRD